jgi:hypothetical protein
MNHAQMLGYFAGYMQKQAALPEVIAPLLKSLTKTNPSRAAQIMTRATHEHRPSLPSSPDKFLSGISEYTGKPTTAYLPRSTDPKSTFQRVLDSIHDRPSYNRAIAESANKIKGLNASVLSSYQKMLPEGSISPEKLSQELGSRVSTIGHDFSARTRALLDAIIAKFSK